MVLKAMQLDELTQRVSVKNRSSGSKPEPWELQGLEVRERSRKQRKE